QGLACHPDGGDGFHRGLAVLRGNGCDGVADIADDAVVAEQGDRRAHACDRARRREIELSDTGVCELRAEDDAFLLSVMMDIDGVFGGPRHFRARLDAWRSKIVAVE